MTMFKAAPDRRCIQAAATLIGLTTALALPAHAAGTASILSWLSIE